jgi:hypothetical protein
MVYSDRAMADTARSYDSEAMLSLEEDLKRSI